MSTPDTRRITATNFGYLESGEMGIEFNDGSPNIHLIKVTSSTFYESVKPNSGRGQRVSVIYALTLQI